MPDHRSIDKKAKIVHLSTNDFGGAGSAALRYHQFFLEAGYDSEMLVAESRAVGRVAAITPVVSEILLVRCKAFARKMLPKEIFSKVRMLVAERSKFSARRKYLFYSVGESATSGLNPSLVERVNSADILFVHWVAGFANSYDVLEIQKKTGCRVYYVTMDMAHLTGGCHYYWQCKGFQSDCADCPVLDQRQKSYAAYQLRAKSLNILRMKATLLAASERIRDAGRLSSIPYEKYRVLPLPVNVELFKPAGTQRVDGRNSPFQILTNANDADDPRKGFEYLLQVLVYLERQLCDDESINLLCLAPERFAHLEFQRIKLVKFDYCNGDAELAALYLKANLFVSTSIEDAGPMMVGEALMCGVPVVTFDVGIAPELIREGGNGFVVERFDVESMASRILMIYRSGATHLESPGMIHDHAALVFSHHRWAAEVYNLISAEI